MLIQFTVENHRSIRNSAVISFAASKDKTFDDRLLQAYEKKKLLPVIAIYGANAAGKTNMLNAMMTMREMVVGASAKISKGELLPWAPFGRTTEPTSFEAVFVYDQIRYTYGFTFDSQHIINEYLYHWPNGRETLIFTRNEQTFKFRENITEQITLSKRTPVNKLYLVSSNNWNLPQTEKAYRWFLEKFTFLSKNDLLTSQLVAQIVSNDDKKGKILKELLLADLGITDVVVKNDPLGLPVITATHRILKNDGSTEYFQLSIDQESSGTQRYLARIGAWLQAIEQGSLLVVDEVEDSLHPLLTRHLISLIQDPNINIDGTQLIFTTHDAMLMDLQLFRRDQIWFAEKNERSCATEFYSLASFSPRKGENVRKGYLQGRFGAIPFIGEVI